MKAIFNKKGGPEVFISTLRSIIGPTEGLSLLDVCCGYAPLTRMLGFPERTFVDVVDRNLAEENPNFIVGDIFKFLADNKKQYSVCTATDCVEHFLEKEAAALMEAIKSVSKIAIIFTPLGDYMIQDDPTNHPDTHKSGWTPEKLGPEWASIVFPDFHPTLGLGAFFAWTCYGIENEFERVQSELIHVL